MEEEHARAGDELALVMADALAACEDYPSALAHLEASAPEEGALPEDYERKRSAWAARVPGGHAGAVRVPSFS